METSQNIYKGELCNNSPFFTIIMAVYNSQAFLTDAIESVLNQSWTDIELILVNDGSSDNSSDICKRFKQIDKRISYIEKKNEGVAIARNRALDIACGQYVLFVDSDDILYPDTLDNLYKYLVRKQCDILRFEFKTIDEKGSTLYPNYELKRRGKYSGNVFSPANFILKILGDEFYLCMNVFRRSIFEQHQLRFSAGCSYMEDCDLILRFLSFSKSCGYSAFIGYGYRKYSNSATSILTKKKYQDILSVFENVVHMSEIATDMDFPLKRVYEGIGLNLYNNTFIFNDITNKEKIIKICTTKPIRLEWKLFPFLGAKFWRLLTLMRKVNRKLFY